MKLKVIDQKGKEVKDITLKDDIFKTDVKESVLAQYVFMFQANQRQSNAHSKIRSEVRGGGKKPHKQKGTGRARSGSNRNPLWTGGGVIFGPRNNRNWKKRITKNFKKAALKSALSNVMKDSNLVVVTDFKLESGKPLTAQAQKIVDAIAKDSKKVMIVTEGKKEEIMNAFANISNVAIVSSGELNAFQVMTGGKLVLEEAVVKTIENKFKKS